MLWYEKLSAICLVWLTCGEQLLTSPAAAAGSIHQFRVWMRYCGLQQRAGTSRKSSKDALNVVMGYLIIEKIMAE